MKQPENHKINRAGCL